MYCTDCGCLVHNWYENYRCGACWELFIFKGEEDNGFREAKSGTILNRFTPRQVYRNEANNTVTVRINFDGSLEVIEDAVINSKFEELFC